MGLSDSDLDIYGFIQNRAAQSLKGTVMSLFLRLSLLFLFVVQACTVEESSPTADAETDSRPEPVLASQASSEGNPDRMLQVADDRTAGRVKPREYLYVDSATGMVYQMNSGWRVLPRQAAPAERVPLAKAAAGLIQTWTDWSGQVETRIYECVTPTKAQHQSLGCQVEPGFLLTGGGAYADYGTGSGALLWETRPLDFNQITWVASSKDHTKSNPHLLYVYAIGMRLKDSTGSYIPRNALMDIIGMRITPSFPATHYPSFVDGMENHKEVLHVGGGARTNWSREGSLLTQLEFERWQGHSWFKASAKDHAGAAELTTLSNYAILAWASGCCSEPKIYIPKFGALEFSYPSTEGSSVGTGVAVAYRDATPGSVVLCPGGVAEWTSGPGRLLFGIKPTGTFQGQFGVYSKDHRDVSAGYNIANLVEVRKARF